MGATGQIEFHLIERKLCNFLLELELVLVLLLDKCHLEANSINGQCKTSTDNLQAPRQAGSGSLNQSISVCVHSINRGMRTADRGVGSGGSGSSGGGWLVTNQMERRAPS